MTLAMLRRMQAREKPEVVLTWLAYNVRRMLREYKDFAFSFEEIKNELQLEDGDDILLRAAIGYLLNKSLARIRPIDSRIEYWQR